MTTARARRRKIYQRATAIARDVRTADFPEAVNIIARLIAGPMTRKRPNLVEEIQRKIADALDLPPNLKVEFSTEPLQPSTDVVMIEGSIPVSAPLARELVADGTLVTRTAIDSYVDAAGQLRPHMRDQVSAVCDRDCPRKRASWPGCCKLNDRVDMSDVFEPAGPDSFGGEDGMHSPAAETIRREIAERSKK